MSAVQLGEPHHDGSPLYVSDPDPTPGCVLTVRVWVPHREDGAPAAEEVLLRSGRDGEPVITEAKVETSDAWGAWWSAPLRLHNPVTSYRFLLTGGAGGYRWLNGTGVHAHDLTDASDFRISTEHRLPDWVLDQIGYQVFPDRFARGTTGGSTMPSWALPAQWDDPVIHRGPEVPRQVFGGTLDGAAAHLDHVQDVGASLLYLTPVFEGRSNHRYDAVSFDRVDPLLGGDEAFARLVEAAHRRGLRIVGDLTTNHTGDGHDWFRRALGDPTSAERGFYRFTGTGDYESWLGVPSLPKLDHSSAELRLRLYHGSGSVVARWLGRGLDGWRIDVANMTGRLGADDRSREVARSIRRTMASTGLEPWLLAEHGHDASLDLGGDGWHGTMDYAGFTRPVWSWLNGGSARGPGHPHGLAYLGLPVDIPVLGGSAAVAAMRQVHAAMPWRSWTGSTSHLDSHDTARFRTVAGGGTTGWVDATGVGRDRHLVGVALQMTMPGMPVIFMGDEIGLTGVDGEHSRTPFPWGRSDEWDRATLDEYRTLTRLRLSHIALRRGGLRWVHAAADSLTFLREHPDETVLVHVSRSPHPSLELPLSGLRLRSAGQLHTLYGEPVTAGREGTVTLPDHGPAAHIYALETTHRAATAGR